MTSINSTSRNNDLAELPGFAKRRQVDLEGGRGCSGGFLAASLF